VSQATDEILIIEPPPRLWILASPNCGTSRQRHAFLSNDDCYVENQVLDSRAPQIDLVALAGSGARSDFERDGPARFGHPVSVT
jgi:hypothetical protein